MRAGVKQQLALYEQFKDRVNIITIYIKEAHTRDEWPLGNNFCWKRPTNLEERLHIANKFHDDYNYTIPIVVDDMDNDFADHFMAWPERYYAIFGGKLQFKAMPHGDSYEWDDLCAWVRGWLDGEPVV